MVSRIKIGSYQRSNLVMYISFAKKTFFQLVLEIFYQMKKVMKNIKKVKLTKENNSFVGSTYFSSKRLDRFWVTTI